MNRNIKKIIHHFSRCHSVSKDILYWSTVLTICKHQVGWLYRPFLCMRKSRLPVRINFFKACDGHLVVILEEYYCVWWLKFLRGLSLAMQSHSYLGWGPFSTMLFDTHDGHIAMETLINPSAVRVLWLYGQEIYCTLSPSTLM